MKTGSLYNRKALEFAAIDLARVYSENGDK